MLNHRMAWAGMAWLSTLRVARWTVVVTTTMCPETMTTVPTVDAKCECKEARLLVELAGEERERKEAAGVLEKRGHVMAKEARSRRRVMGSAGDLERNSHTGAWHRPNNVWKVVGPNATVCGANERERTQLQAVMCAVAQKGKTAAGCHGRDKGGV